MVGDAGERGEGVAGVAGGWKGEVLRKEEERGRKGEGEERSVEEV